MQPETVKRKIHFFQIIAENCTFPEVVITINNLPEGNEIYSGNSTKKVYIESFDQKNGYYGGIIRSVKMNNFPSKGKLGIKQPEPLNLADDEGLADATHFLFFPNSKILAVEYNHTGARATGIIDHLNQKLMDQDCENKKSLSALPLFSRDVIEKLNTIGEIKMLNLMVPKTRISDLKKVDNDLFESLDKAKNLWGTEEVGLVLKAAPRSKKSILKDPSALLDKLKSLFSITPPSETFDKLNIKALHNKTGEICNFDLLEEKIESEIKVVKLNRTREIDTEDIFSAIKQAFEANKEKLLALLTPQQ